MKKRKTRLPLKWLVIKKVKWVFMWLWIIISRSPVVTPYSIVCRIQYPPGPDGMFQDDSIEIVEAGHVNGLEINYETSGNGWIIRLSVNDIFGYCCYVDDRNINLIDKFTFSPLVDGSLGNKYIFIKW